MASSTRPVLISRPGAESCSSTIRRRAAAKSGSTAGCEMPTERRTACRRHSGRIALRIGRKIRHFSRYTSGTLDRRILPGFIMLSVDRPLDLRETNYKDEFEYDDDWGTSARKEQRATVDQISAKSLP